MTKCTIPYQNANYVTIQLTSSIQVRLTTFIDECLWWHSDVVVRYFLLRTKIKGGLHWMPNLANGVSRKGTRVREVRAINIHSLQIIRCVSDSKQKIGEILKMELWIGHSSKKRTHIELSQFDLLFDNSMQPPFNWSKVRSERVSTHQTTNVGWHC